MMLPLAATPSLDGQGESSSNYRHQEGLWRRVTNLDVTEEARASDPIAKDVCIALRSDLLMEMGAAGKVVSM